MVKTQCQAFFNHVKCGTRPPSAQLTHLKSLYMTHAQRQLRANSLQKTCYTSKSYVQLLTTPTVFSSPPRACAAMLSLVSFPMRDFASNRLALASHLLANRSSTPRVRSSASPYHRTQHRGTSWLPPLRPFA